jgi:hypothetical protein
MKRKNQFALALVILTLIVSCNSKNAVQKYKLTDNERRICDSLQIDTTVIQDIRMFNTYTIEPFHYSLSKMIKDGQETESDPIHLKGLVFSEQNSKSYDLVFKLKDAFKKKGYTIFLVENNFDISNRLDHIGVLKTTDPYTVLRQIGTNGINYGITNDSLLSVIKQFDKGCSLELVGASGDWCDFVIHNEPADWNSLAQEVYRVCPDVVDQGTGTIEELASAMKETKRLYFWWD